MIIKVNWIEVLHLKLQQSSWRDRLHRYLFIFQQENQRTNVQTFWSVGMLDKTFHIRKGAITYTLSLSMSIFKVVRKLCSHFRIRKCCYIFQIFMKIFYVLLHILYLHSISLKCKKDNIHESNFLCIIHSSLFTSLPEGYLLNVIDTSWSTLVFITELLKYYSFKNPLT